MKILFPVFTTVLVLAVSGCAPQVDMEAERAAVHKFHDECMAAIPNGIVDCFAEDGQLLPPKAPPIKGKSAIGELVAQVTGDPNFSASHDIVNIEVSHSGDLAYIHYTYELILSDPDGNPIAEQGNAIYILKKQPQAGWKFLFDIWNVDADSNESAQLAAHNQVEQNKALCRQILDLINQRKLDEAFALYAEDYIYHGPGGQELRGRQAIRGLWEVFLAGFPDLHATIDDMIVEGDRMAVRWRIEGTHTGEFMGIAPTNRKIEIGLNELFRTANGQAVEAWDSYDMYGLMQQIGAIPIAEEESVE